MRPPLPGGPYLIVGLARSGVSAARALQALGETVVGFDADPTSGPTVAALRDEGVSAHAGGDGVALLDGIGCVVKSPGVPREAAVVAAALERGVPVLGELELAWRLLDQPFVAVTGTNGKTTTVELLGVIYRAAGLAVELAGNVGRALSGLVSARADSAATVVCEASSFQLEDTIAFAPEAAVLLNLTEDHLDRHHSFEAYREAKLRIFANQPAGTVAIVPEDLLDPGAHQRGSKRLGIPGSGQLVKFGVSDRSDLRLRAGSLYWRGQRLLEAASLGARGPVENSMAAAAVALARGVPLDAVRSALQSFRGVAHRLEELATIDGVLYVNDSKATNVASTLVALNAFEAGSVLLILGGQGKGQDFTALRDAVAQAARHTYVIGEDAERIAAALDGLALTRAGTLERAVALSRRAAAPGTVVLLSPACASFDQFADFEARGEAFRELIGKKG